MKYEIREVQLLSWKKSTSKAPPQITFALLNDKDVEWFENLTVAKGKVSGQLLEIAFKLSEQDDQCPPGATSTPENRLDEPSDRTINMGRARPCSEPEAPTPTASELHDEEPRYGKDGLDKDGFPKPVGKSEERRFAIQRKAKKEATDKQKEAAIKNYRAQPDLTRKAIGLCNNEKFQAYVAMQYGKEKKEVTSGLAKVYIYAVCRIKSLTELTDNNFNPLLTTFKKWRDEQ